MTKEQLEASIKFAETLFQICTVVAVLFGLRAWLLNNKLKQLQAAEIAQLNKDTANAQLALEKEKSARADMGRKMGEIANYGAQLRHDKRSGIEGLLKYIQDPEPTVQTNARETLVQAASDLVYTSGGRNDKTWLGESIHSPSKLMKIIREDQAPIRIEAAFHAMQERFNWNVQPFDIPAAEKWCADNKPKCDE
jgi:hypothetical protein